MFQQWEKGREKTTFPIVFNYEYNRQKFANLDKADKKIIPPPRVAPTPVSSHDRKLRKRKSRSLERRRQPKNIELSDSDEDITVNSAQQPTKASLIGQNFDEVDHCAVTVSPTQIKTTTITDVADANHANDQIEKSPLPAAEITLATLEPTLNDSQLDANFSRIEESSTSASISGPESHSQNVIVDVHEPDIVLEIREETDEGPIRSSSFQTKLTKDNDLDDVPENEAENDRPDEDDKRSVTQSPTSMLSITEIAADNRAVEPEPLDLVQTCDINENMVLNEKSVNNSNNSIVEVDHNHNDLSKSVDQNGNNIKTIPCETIKHDETVQKRFDQRRISESSRSSFDESDGMDTEPTYARVESLKSRVSFV